jgi:hypothetical protein
MENNFEINSVLEQSVKVEKNGVINEYLIKDIIKILDIGDIVHKNDQLVPNFAIVFALASSYQKMGFDLELLENGNIVVKNKVNE